MTDLPEKFLKLRKSLNMTQQEIAKTLGLSQRTWACYENGTASPKVKTLIKMGELGYKIPGITPSIVEDMIDKGTITRKELEDRNAYARTLPLDTYIDTLPPMARHSSFLKFTHGHTQTVTATGKEPESFVLLPQYAQTAAAGRGQQQTQLAEVEAYLPILCELLNGANPKDCGIVRVVGDSMVDMSLFNGDMVIFDRTQLEGNGVYVISIGDEVRVKRLEYRQFEQKIIISSENTKSYPTPEVINYEQAESLLRVYGKVICWMHKHPY